jgi:hypothetical protein
MSGEICCLNLQGREGLEVDVDNNFLRFYTDPKRLTGFLQASLINIFNNDKTTLSTPPNSMQLNFTMFKTRNGVT